jgi:hypothetical protein
MDNVLCKIMVRLQFRHLWKSRFVLWQVFAAFIIRVGFDQELSESVVGELPLVYLVSVKRVLRPG